jgi:hypothetical protein
VRHSRTLVLALATLSMAGCTSLYDEVCNSYDSSPESVRLRVLHGVTLPPGAEVIACQSRPDGSFGDEEACLIRISAADFESTFPSTRFGVDRPGADPIMYAPMPHVLAEAHGVKLAWVRGSADRPASGGIFSNEARDRVVVYVLDEDRCAAPAEII